MIDAYLAQVRERAEKTKEGDYISSVRTGKELAYMDIPRLLKLIDAMRGAVEESRASVKDSLPNSFIKLKLALAALAEVEKELGE